ncbi:unnamed protein product [Spirodela intermedia]|uniref:Uncharacterized protein n=1 Tax=Spirodela intermedia TaxID=51605 RepID=A0A7I8JKL7_SPIIN|nr:unnamed protein product [Spirodela intermedia]CAA6670002.1 unnamed protein product [Spirodela intermedia]
MACNFQNHYGLLRHHNKIQLGIDMLDDPHDDTSRELSENAGLTTSGAGPHIYPVLGGGFPLYLFFPLRIKQVHCYRPKDIKNQKVRSLTGLSSVLAFGVLASSVSAICIFCFQEFVVPDLLTFFLMVILGVLAFFAEVFLARGLQLEKISKATTIQYLKVRVTVTDVGRFIVTIFTVLQ